MSASSTSTPRVVKVVLFGVGNVGAALVSLILRSRPYHLSLYNLRFDFTALADSSGYVHSSPSPLSDSQLASLLSHKAAKRPLSSFPGGLPSPSPLAVAQATVDPRTVVVDCAATPHTLPALLHALTTGGGITLANKQPLCTPLPSFTTLLSPPHRARVRYESTVGAGTPFISTLHRLLASHDPPHSITGTFSGTLGFLCSGLQAGRRYSDVVRDAHQRGYTEPDPRDDLGGVDVARKALILARTMGWRVEMADVEVEPLYPKRMEGMGVAEFLDALPQLDEEYEVRQRKAEGEGRVLRYVAVLEGGRVRVGLEGLEKDTPIGRLQGTENMVEYKTDVYNERGLVVQGAGAGGEVTASGVMGDMVELAYVIGRGES